MAGWGDFATDGGSNAFAVNGAGSSNSFYNYWSVAFE